MTTRERAAEIVRRISLIHFPDDNVRLRLMTAIEAALAAAYEEGTSELIINAQVEYLRGQAEERERCARIAEDWQACALEEDRTTADHHDAIAAAIRRNAPPVAIRAGKGEHGR